MNLSVIQQSKSKDNTISAGLKNKTKHLFTTHPPTYSVGTKESLVVPSTECQFFLSLNRWEVEGQGSLCQSGVSGCILSSLTLLKPLGYGSFFLLACSFLCIYLACVNLCICMFVWFMCARVEDRGQPKVMYLALTQCPSQRHWAG